jgi:hypothetical protein
MIDFSTIQLDRLVKFLSTLSGNTDPTQYFDVGRMIEIAYQEYSNTQLERINLVGKDLRDNFGKTYESKKVTFTNKSLMAVRKVIVMNGYGTPDINRFTPADYYIFTDPGKLKACCVPGSMLYNIKVGGSVITASCNPKPEHFFLNGGSPISKNFFQEKEKFIMNFIRSIE